MRNRELNSVRISNPDGLYKKYREPNRISPKNMRRGAIQEASSRSFREMVRVAELRRRRRVGKPERRRGKKTDIRQAARGASMAGHALLIFTAVVFCAVVYVSSLTIRVRPCSSMATALAFQTSFRNPDETPLRATLSSERESYDKDFVGVAYLLFEGLEKRTKYALSIVNLETEEKIYSSTFLTAEEDPYQIQVEDPIVTEEGLFQFSLSIGGLEGAFYTVYVMDENGKAISVTDHSEAQATFSIPIKSLAAPSEETGQQSGATGQASDGAGTQSDATGQQSGGAGQASAETGEQAAETGQRDMDALPFITVKVNGETFLPRVWNSEKEPEPVREGATEAPDAESVVETVNPDEIEWVWNGEHTEVSAFAPDPEQPGETVSLDAAFTETIAKEADCTEAGLAVYELSAVDGNGVEYTDVQTEVIPPKGHSYERVRLDEAQNGTSAEYVCAVCGETYRIDAAFTEETD